MTITAYTVADQVLQAVDAALLAIDHRIETRYVAAGIIAWDNPCGMLVTAPERVFETANFPLETFPTVNGVPAPCVPTTVAIDIVCLLVRCIPVLTDDGRPPSNEALGAAYGAALEDAAVVWNTFKTGLNPNWELASTAQTFVGAEGGAIGVETRVTIGIDIETFCLDC